MALILLAALPRGAAAERSPGESTSIGLTVEETPLSRRAAIDGPLGRFSSAESMTSRDPRVRIAAADRLARFGPVEHALAVLHDALTRETDLEVRFALVRALGLRGDARSVPVLIDELQSGSDAEVLLAVDALRAIGGPAAGQGLVAALAIPMARQRAIDACDELDDAVLPSLLEAVRLDPGNVAALEAVARVLDGDTAVRADLVTALSASATHPASDVRAPAVRALGSTRDPRALPLVRARLRDEAPEVVRAAFTALGDVGDVTDAAMLRDHVVEASPFADEALRALSRLDEDAAHAAIQAVFARADAARRAEIATAVFATRGSAATLALLVEVDAAAAISALAARPDEASFAALVRTASSPAPASALARVGLAVALRRGAADGGLEERARALLDGPRLRAIAGDADVTSTLERDLASPDPNVRAAAALGLEWLGAGSEALERAFATEQDAHARRAECAALESLGVGTSAFVVDAALASPELLADCAVYIARGLSGMSSRRRRAFRSAFRAALHASDERLASAAARALAASSDHDAVQALVAAVERGGSARVLAAARALFALGETAALERVRGTFATRESRDALARVMRPEVLDVLWVRLVLADGRSGVDVDLVGSDGRVRRARSSDDGFVIVPFGAGGTVDVRVLRPETVRDR